MSSVLLDTSAYSAFHRGHVEIGAAVRRAQRTVITPIVLGELLGGFRNGRDRRTNESVLDRFLAAPTVDIVQVDRGTADCYAAVQASLREAGTSVDCKNRLSESRLDVWL